MGLVSLILRAKAIASTSDTNTSACSLSSYSVGFLLEPLFLIQCGPASIFLLKSFQEQ